MHQLVSVQAHAQGDLVHMLDTLLPAFETLQHSVMAIELVVTVGRYGVFTVAKKFGLDVTGACSVS